MSEWKTSSIDESCEILDSQRIPINDEQRSLIPGTIPYYGANGVQGYIGKYIFDEPLILLAEDGGNFDDYQNRPIAYRISGKSWVNNHAHILRSKTCFSQDFVFYSLVHKNITSCIKGGTRSKLNQADLKEITFIHPTSLPEQRKIARILSSVDAVIEKTEAAIAKYKAIKSGMMRDLFTRGIDLKTGKLRPRYEDTPELYKQSELGWVPKEWEISELSECLSILKDGTHLPPKRVLEGPLLLSVQNIVEGKFTLTKNDTRVPWEFYNTAHKTWQIQSGDVFLTIVGATIGKACAAPNNLPPYMLQRSVAILRGQSGLLNTPFLYFYVLSSFFLTQLMNSANQTAQPGVYLGEIAKIKIGLPKVEEQNIAEAFFSSISTIIESETASLEKFKSIKQALMSDLLTGKVRVTVSEP